MKQNKKSMMTLGLALSMACLAAPVAPVALAQTSSPDGGSRLEALVSGPGGHRMDVLLDLSYSMKWEACKKGGESISRLEIAKNVALGWLESQPKDNQDYLNSISSPDPAVPSTVAVWTFQSNGDGDYLTKIVDYTDLTSGAQAIRAIQEDHLDGSTPLAGSICRVLDTITGVTVSDVLMSGGQVNPAFIGHRFFVATDGEENATPSTNECDGETSQLTMADTPPGQFFPDFEPSTWQHKVAQKFLRFGDSAGVLIQDAEIPTPVVDAVYLLPNVFYGHGCNDLKQASKKAPARRYPTAHFLQGLTDYSKGEIQVVLPDLVTGEIDLDALVQLKGPLLDEIVNEAGVLDSGFLASLASAPFAKKEGIAGVFDSILHGGPLAGGGSAGIPTGVGQVGGGLAIDPVVLRPGAFAKDLKARPSLGSAALGGKAARKRLPRK